MEEDLDILERALLNLEATESEKEKSEFKTLYKNWGKEGGQEERRKQLLETQKVNRNNKVDWYRGILELVNAVEDNDKLFKPHKKVHYRPNIYVAGFHKTCLTYSNVLMLSEWMIEKPCDFLENWYVVPCPKGVRVLIVATNGTTKFYTKHGQFKFQKCTNLPGGNPYSCLHRKNCCVLDGFYYERTNTLYILDLLAWNNQPMTDGETEFRQYWMNTQLEDFPDTKIITKNNQVIIEVLPMMSCSVHYLSHLLSTYPYFDENVPPLDGLLFYHRRAHYVAGETPLVGWLYPYMIPEVLGEEFKMHPGYLAERPADYVNQAEFIKKFELKYPKKNKRRTSKNMETDSNNADNIKKDTNEEESELMSEATAENSVSMNADVGEKSGTAKTSANGVTEYKNVSMDAENNTN